MHLALPARIAIAAALFATLPTAAAASIPDQRYSLSVARICAGALLFEHPHAIGTDAGARAAARDIRRSTRRGRRRSAPACRESCSAFCMRPMRSGEPRGGSSSRLPCPTAPAAIHTR